MKTIYSLILFLIFCASFQCEGEEFKVASVFGDGMVLQRDKAIVVWGWGQPNEKVEIELGGEKKETSVDKDEYWMVKLGPLSAGGPYTLKATSGVNTTLVQNILSGDVWLCSGQSNMQMAVKDTQGSEAALKRAENYSKVRLLSMTKGGSGKPSLSTGSKWQACDAQTASKFSAVGFYFAEGLLKDPSMAGVPIGLIDSSFGGTAIEAWIPAEGVADFKEDQMSASMFKIGPSSLFNGMISPLVPLGLKGVVWYQGEANAGKAENYQQLLTTLIAQWRKIWDDSNLPFVIVQLPAFTGKIGGKYFTGIREAQAKAVAQNSNCGLVVTIDTASGEDLHPREKKIVGERVALCALNLAYKKEIEASGPKFKDVEFKDKKAIVSFDTGGKDLTPKNPYKLEGFSVAGSDGIYQYVEGTVEGNKVVLDTQKVSNPQTIRYAWGAVPKAELYSANGLPAIPFRTDTWPLENQEFLREPAQHVLSSELYQIEIDSKGKVVSFGVRGVQFLSNNLGGSGGTSLPGAFGPRELSNFTEINSQSVSFNDSDITFQISARVDGMTWSLSNRGSKELAFRISFAPQVEAVAEADGIQLKRGKAQLKIKGAGELSSPSADGFNLSTKIPPQGQADIVFLIPNK